MTNHPEFSFVAVSTTAAGTFYPVMRIDDWRHRRSREGVENHYFFAEEEAYSTGGDLTGELTLSGAYDPDDTTGQAILEAALETGGYVYARAMRDATNGKQVRCTVTAHDYGGNRNDDEWLNVSMTLQTAGVTTNVPAAV